MSVQLSGPPQGTCGARLDLALLRRRAQRLLGAIGHAHSELSIALIDDAAIATLNEKWRGRLQPTDVLSFSLLEGAHEEQRGPLLGDVVIGIEVAAAQARQRHRRVDEVVARLVIHGLLHLVGHDHEEDDDACRMRAEERRLWKLIWR